MSGLGLGMVVDQLADLKLGELLDTPPPGLDEAVAIAKARTRPCTYISMTTHVASRRTGATHGLHNMNMQISLECLQASSRVGDHIVWMLVEANSRTLLQSRSESCSRPLLC